jgi:hypothetical protein
MPDPIAERLSSLPLLEKSVLRQLWRELFGVSPPPTLRRDFMIPILAYRLQERAFGALKPSTRKQLDHLAALTTNPNQRSGARSYFRVGTRLVRQWGNRTHVVNVENQAYEYDGTRYKSLSQIARLITGTRWSGPLFFGVKRNKGRRDSARVVA